MKKIPNSIICNSEKVKMDIIAVSSEKENLPSIENKIGWACGEQSFKCNFGLQLTKFCYGLQEWRKLQPDKKYDWYVKIRPEIILNEPVDLSKLTPKTINARVREYEGPLKLKNATSIGCPKILDIYHNHLRPSKEEKIVILDDQFYIFDDYVLKNGIFDLPLPSEIEIAGIKKYETIRQDEWFHSGVWKDRGAILTPTSIDATFTRGDIKSGDLQGIDETNF